MGKRKEGKGVIRKKLHMSKREGEWLVRDCKYEWVGVSRRRSMGEGR